MPNYTQQKFHLGEGQWEGRPLPGNCGPPSLLLLRTTPASIQFPTNFYVLLNMEMSFRHDHPCHALHYQILKPVSRPSPVK